MDVFVAVVTHVLMVTMNLKTWAVNITVFPLQIHVIFEIRTSIICQGANSLFSYNSCLLGHELYILSE